MEIRLNLDISYPHGFRDKKEWILDDSDAKKFLASFKGKKHQSLCGAIVKPLSQARRVKPIILTVLSPDTQSLELGHRDMMPMLPKRPR